MRYLTYYLPLLVAMLCATTARADDAALIGRWTMEADGQTVTDSGPHGLHAELLNGATSEDGRENGRAVRVGTDKAQVRLPQAGQLDRAVEAVTFTSWIKLDRRPTEGGAVIVTKRPAWHSPSPYVLLVAENGGLVFDGNDGTGWFHARSKGNLIKNDTWHHVAFGYDTQDGLHVFVDGEQVATAPAREALQRNSHRVALGHEEGSEHVRRSPLTGLIGETRFYAAKLTPEQIKQDMGGREVAARRQAGDTTAARGGQAELLPDGRVRASIVFDATPVERGMTFARNAISPATVEVEGETIHAWQVKHGSSPAAGWLRSLYLTLTDERMRNGNMPAVDVEVEVLYDEHAGFDVRADTQRGDARVGGTWGGRNRFRTVRARIDDGFFGAREHRGDGQAVDGYDLRLNGANGDWYIRSITVTGYDLESDPDFSRLLRITNVSTPDRLIFLYERGESSQLTYTIANNARVPFEGRHVFTLTGRDGTVVTRDESDVTFDATGETQLSFTFDTSGLPFGVYDTRLEIFGTDNSEEPLLARSGSIGVKSDTELRKAEPGEYLYGLDPQLGLPDRDEAVRAWMRELGVDIIRMGIDLNAQGRAREAIEALRGDGIEILPMLDVPKDVERQAFAASLDRAEQFAATLAAEYRFPYWELGNEPDLPFFFPGDIDQYLEGYYAMYDAIKEADPDTLVMNGGLANASHLQVSMDRTREFIEKVDPDKIDILAYHAHGAGVDAERNSLNRIRRLLTEFGKQDIPTMDTETGVSARSSEQEMTQAATAVQKTVFVQSQGHPTMMWFRLRFESDLSYGHLYTSQEPRPAAMAYRAMVEQLRGFRFSSLLETGNPDVEVYVFDEIDGDRRIAVAWANTPASHSVNLRLGTDSAEMIDLFGNASGLDTRGGVAGVDVTDMPLYVRWTSGDVLAVARPALDADALRDVVPGRDNPAVVRVRNPLDRAVDATLTLDAQGELDPRITPSSVNIRLEAGQELDVPVTLATGAEPTIKWPDTWQLRIDDAQPQTVAFTGDLLDVAALAGGARERRPATLTADVTSRGDQTVTFGASGDWWMEWMVNDATVYSTLENGNGGGFSVTDHTFDVPLKDGDNTVQITLLSGSHGWKLHTAPPRDVKSARNPNEPADRVTLTLAAGGETLATQMVALSPVTPLRELSENAAPVALLAERHVDNPNALLPDASLWHAGDQDLSARVYLGTQGGSVALRVVVRDDVHTDGDGLTLRLGSVTGESREMTVNDGTRGDDGTTTYNVRISPDMWPGDDKRLSLVVNDDDGGGKRQTLSWHRDEEPSRWFRVVLP